MPSGENPKPRKQIKKTGAFIYKVDEYILLPKINENLKISFSEVLNNRRSERKFSKLTLNQISELLWHSSKVKRISITDEGKILTHRNAPSAGAIHPIDIFISLPSAFEKRTLYYYDPFIHKLAKIDIKQKALSLFFKKLNKNLSIENSTIVWFALDIDRTAEKYKSPESLVWRDAGALIMLFQLVATALQIKSCPAGTLGNPFFSNSFKSKKLISGGGLLLG